MVIGIAKFGKKVYFYQNEEDHASWSFEVTQVAKILVSKGHHVIMLTPTDLINKEHLTSSVDRPIDRIYLFNGKNPTEDEIKGLKAYTNDVRLIITDMNLIPTDLTPFSAVYSQSKRIGKYAYIEQNTIFDADPINLTYKENYFYFGGTERNRLKDCIEYLWRPNCIWKGKSEFFGFNNYIPFHEHIRMLMTTRYTIVIGDEDYNKAGFVTPRFYECLKYGIIPFVDRKFDPEELIIPQNHFLRVNNYQQMLSKMKEIDKDNLHNEIIKMLINDHFTKEALSGNNIYNAII